MPGKWIIRVLNDPDEGVHPEIFEFKIIQNLKRSPCRNLTWKISLGKKNDTNQVVQVKAVSITKKRKKRIFDSENLLKEFMKILRTLEWSHPLAELEYIDE